MRSGWEKVGEMRNCGIEMRIGGEIMGRKEWLWRVEVKMGYKKKKVEKVYGEEGKMMIMGGGGKDRRMGGGGEKVLKVGYRREG